MSLYQRVHYFTVQTCKRVFRHPEYGIVRFDDMIANADEYVLKLCMLPAFRLKIYPFIIAISSFRKACFQLPGFFAISGPAVIQTKRLSDRNITMVGKYQIIKV